MMTDKDRLISRYIEALFAGDLEAQMEILEGAEGNAALIRELWETNVSAGEDLVYAAQANEVRTLAEGMLGVTALTTPRDAVPIEDEVSSESPVLLADVAAQLRSEIVRGTARVPDREAALQATDVLAQRHEPLSEEALSERGARSLLNRLGIQLGRWFEDLFHGAAFDLEMGRREDLRLAAARRTRPRDTPSQRGDEKEHARGK